MDTAIASAVTAPELLPIVRDWGLTRVKASEFNPLFQGGRYDGATTRKASTRFQTIVQYEVDGKVVGQAVIHHHPTEDREPFRVVCAISVDP